uniref:Ig-like domain-containing protein n=1 Tax=Pavo cristatus TaxID=9049 RepID=A0A8C9LDC9_PAVCR
MTTKAPTFTQPLQSVVALEGSAATFEAHISGFPVPEVSWYRDGQVLSAATLPGVQISFSDGRAKLVIPSVTEANSGRYTIQATNGSGQATSTAELLVTESAPPQFPFTEGLKNKTVTEGESVTLECHISGHPQPAVTWYREDYKIESSMDFQITFKAGLARLVIREAFAEDSGRFTCTATNKAGSVSTSCHLHVKGKYTFSEETETRETISEKVVTEEKR